MPKPPKPIDPFEDIGASLPTFEDDAEALQTLRQAARGDPVKGGWLNVAPAGSGEEELVEPGAWRASTCVDYVTGLPRGMPVTPLGKLVGKFYFLDTLGAVHTLEANAGKGHIDALFAGRAGWLCWAWPRWSQTKDGSRGQVVNWAAEDARQDLFAACAYKGTFELEEKVRGRGAWADADGSLIYHAGDAVWIGGAWRAPGEHGDHIYPGRPRIGRPAHKLEAAGPGSPGDVLLQALESWHWDRPELDPRLALGWLALAQVGGALEQRPVIYVVGGEGTGKTTLQKLLRLLMNGALVSTSNTTQAGIYQKVKQDSVAVMVDEMGDKEDTRNAQKILELARIAYSGDTMSRGTQGGEGQEFAIRSSFAFSSITLPSMDSQDASRMAVLMLRDRPPPLPGEKGVDVLKALGMREAKMAHLVGRQLLRRTVEWFAVEGGRSRWERLLELFRETLLAAGHDARGADTFGALAAGSHMALFDELPSPAQLAEWAVWLAPAHLAETESREKTWRKCLIHMLNAQPESLRNFAAQIRSVGEAIDRFRLHPESAADVDMDAALKLNGLAMSWPQGAPKDWAGARLFVPAKHPALVALFKDTAWAGRLGAPGPWGGVLRQMPPELWDNGKCEKGLDAKASGIFIRLAAALEA